ncbi:MAG: PTS sugar transporter subunit IIA [Candidatus Auribacterota bacterium]|nr:PTS sugar transporter subunit IIA [Candidatus Auribacterota bacterium]
MKISDILTKERCEINLRSRTKPEVIREIAGIFKNDSILNNVSVDEIERALTEREELGTTGIGHGLAIPHCRLSGADRFIMVLAISRRGISYKSLDHHRVRIFCAFIGPEDQPEKHVHLLAEISMALRNETARREMITAPTRTALYENFLSHSVFEILPDPSRKWKLLMLVLQDEEYFTEIMEVFVEMGIPGATVIESQGAGKILTQVPLFASFINFLGEQGAYHRTIFALVPEDLVNRLIDNIEGITGDLNKRTGTMVLVLDAPLIKGSLQGV